jgi:hypothetical protein
MGRPPKPHSRFIVGIRVDEDGFLEVTQPAELLEIEFAGDDPLTMRPVQIEDPSDGMGLPEPASEFDPDSF